MVKDLDTRTRKSRYKKPVAQDCFLWRLKNDTADIPQLTWKTVGWGLLCPWKVQTLVCNAVLMVASWFLRLECSTVMCQLWTSSVSMAIWLCSDTYALCLGRHQAAQLYRACFQAMLPCSDRLSCCPFYFPHSPSSQCQGWPVFNPWLRRRIGGGITVKHCNVMSLTPLVFLVQQLDHLPSSFYLANRGISRCMQFSSWRMLFFFLSCSMAWASFTCCMASAVTTLNTYTKTVLEFKRNHIKGYEASFKDQPQHQQYFIQQQISSYYEPRDKPLHSVSEGVDFYSELQQKVLQREPELELDEVLGQTIGEDRC